MSTLSYQDAIDDMSRHFNELLKENAPDPGIRVEWEGVAKLSPPPGDESWMRFTIRHFAPVQPETFGKRGSKIYSREGLVTVQIFSVNSQGQGKVQAGLLATVVRDIFQGRRSEGGVVFYRTLIQEIGEDRLWYNINVVSSFRYDEIG
jgi:hypothetical protein